MKTTILKYLFWFLVLMGCKPIESNYEKHIIDIGFWNMKTEQTKVIQWQLKPGYQIASISATVMDDADFGWTVFPAKNLMYFSGEIYLTVPPEYNLNLYSDTLRTRGTIIIDIIKFDD
jgi:hypothetical protein